MIFDNAKSFIRDILILAKIIEEPDYIFQLVEDHPVGHEIKPGIVYVVGNKGYQKWAYFRCPTDLDEIIQLSIMKNHRPCWSVKTDWIDRPTIYPSIRQTSGSYAHFWLRHGNVQLCYDCGEPPSL